MLGALRHVQHHYGQRMTPPADPMITDWIQAAATAASVGVAVWATVVAQSAKATSIRAKADGKEAVNWAVSVGNDEINDRLREKGKTVWTISKGSGDSYDFTNCGDQAVKLVGVKDVTRAEPSSAVMLLPGYEDVFISPGNAFKIILARSLATPAVVKVEVEWVEGPQTVRQVYAVA